jgi:hypothetical protein
MNRTTAIAIILTLTGSALANPAPKLRRVSRYMRDTGILYLETVEKLMPECGQKNTHDSNCMSRWESAMKGIEDRVDIALNDKAQPRAPGDLPYWDLLKNVKYARKFYVIADSSQQKAWSHAYITCQAHAHTIALDGDFDGDGGCGDAIDAATHQ